MEKARELREKIYERVRGRLSDARKAKKSQNSYTNMLYASFYPNKRKKVDLKYRKLWILKRQHLCRAQGNKQNNQKRVFRR